MNDLLLIIYAIDLLVALKALTNSLEELQNLFSKNISFILCHNTFSEVEALYLWLCNYHLYEVYGETYSRVSFKTDKTLRVPHTI